MANYRTMRSRRRGVANRAALAPQLQTALVLFVSTLLACSNARAIELEVIGLDGKPVRGRLVRLTPEIVLTSPTEELVLAWSEVLAIRPLDEQPSTAPAAADDPLRFELADGSAFGGRIVDDTDRSFTVRFQSGQTGRLELSMLRAVYAASMSAAARAELVETTAEADRSEDVVVVQRGQRVVVLRGAVRRISSEGVLFAWRERERALRWERVAALRFARPTQSRSSCTVCLHDGDVFGGRVTGGDESKIALQSSTFEGLELPWSRIRRIECRSERLTFLSDLAALRYEFTPFFEKHWPYARDRTLAGRPILLAGHEYAKGLTMHSRSALAYALNGRYRQFAVVVGIADEMAERGNVTLAVLGDGRVLWRAEDVRGSQQPREVLLDVTGVRELSLHVDFGEDLDLSDHVCWAFARLIR